MNTAFYGVLIFCYGRLTKPNFMKKSLIFYIIVFVAGILLPNIVKANELPNFYFKQLSQQDGLVQNYVRSITLDHNGFYWIGTRAGLSRFDGYEFRNYQNEAENKNSLSADMIFYVVEDAQDNLWVSTSGGLDLYQRKTDDFEHIAWYNSRFRTQAYLVCDTAIYFAGSGNIFKRSYNTGGLTLMPMKSKEQHSSFTFMAKWGGEQWILATRWNGMWLYNFRTGDIRRTPFVREKEIMATIVDSKGRLWISPYGKGLVGYLPDGTKFAELHTGNSDLSNNIILDIEERDGQLWLATDGGGISVYDMSTGAFQNIRYVVGDANSFPFSSVYCLYKDDSDNMWAGTVRGGMIGIKEVHMFSYRDVPPGNDNGLSDRSVQSLYEDENGDIWIGTDGGGLSCLDPQQNKFRHFPYTFNMKVGSITGYSRDELLVYFYSKGLYLFNRTTGQIRPFLSEEQRALVTRSATSINLSASSPDKILLFTDRICLYDKTDNSLVELSMPSKVNYKGAMMPFYADSIQTYALSQSFVVKVVQNSAKVVSVLTLPEDDGEVINSASRDKNGNLWLGTNKGLLFYNESTRKLERIETNKFREVTSMVYAKSGLWIGAQNMLFHYVEKDKHFLIYGESDGAMSNEYINKATLVSRDGDIYLGGITGLLRIDGDYYSSYAGDDTSPMSLKVADVVLDGVSVRNIAADGVQEIKIPWDYTSLSLKLMVREKDIFRKKMFRYYIKDLDRTFLETYDHTLMLHSLPTGTHEIYVSCSTRDGEWSEPKCLIRLQVVPPWWRQWWFLLLVVIALAAIVYLGFSYSLRKKQNQLLLDLKEKEKKISEDKVRFLINISHELRTPLTLIYAPLKQLLNSDNNDGERLHQQLRRIFKQARQMRNLINMVLDMRRMEVGYEELHLDPHDLNSWLGTVVDDFVEEYQTKGMTLRFEPDPQIGKVVFDKEKCEIVVSNLLMNAFKYSEGNTEVVVMSEKKGNNVRISVKDQGMGLSAKDLSHLFTRFYQGEHKISGSGIGLSYSKTLLEQHGGQIGAYNNEDKGATFWFELPLEQMDGCVAMKSGDYLNNVEPERSEEDMQVPDSIDFSMENYSILVVDDESELRTFMAEAFKGVFKNVYMASDGEEGLAMVRRYQPDIVVSDIMMPKMDGYELCHRLKSDIEISHIPVVLLTVRSSQESRAISYKLGADSYLPKPFDVDLLLTIVRNLLRNRDQVKAYYRSVSGVVKTPEEQTFSNADEKFLRKLNKLIVENLDNTDLDVKYLTVEIGMSRASLYNKVKILTGLGVNDYINRVKIEQAMQMLASTDLSVTEVSERTGFSSSRYFSTLFKQFTSETPTSYKNRMKKTNTASAEEINEES